MAYSKQNFQNGQILNAANLEVMENGIIAGQGAQNLLDNSDFRIAQAGYGGMHGTQKYACDRWYDTYGFGTFSFDESRGLTVAYGTNHAYLVQKINNASQYHNKTMTVALQLSDGTTYVNSGTYLSSEISFRISASNWLCDLHPDRIELVVTSGSVTIKWIALYEGSYDVNTLPPYMPKGKHVEMLNCNVPLAPHNLLDNSNFRNPVNQRGITSQIGGGYGLDRWRADGSGTISVESTGVSLTNLSFRQPVQLKAGTYTLAFHLSDGKTLGYVFKFDGSSTLSAINSSWNETTGAYINYYKHSTGVVTVQIVVGEGHTIIVDWAALYEGSYDTSTLPAYQPKGYAAELAECMRYYYQSNDNKSGQSGMIIRRAISIEGNTKAFSLESVSLPFPMRITPTITTYDNVGNANAVKEWYSNDKVSNTSVRYANNRSFCVASEAGEFVGGKSYYFNYTASADL